MQIQTEPTNAYVNLSNDLFRHLTQTKLFFDNQLVLSLRQHFMRAYAIITVYDDGEFVMEIQAEQVLKNDPTHCFHSFSKEDPCSRHINRVCADQSGSAGGKTPLLFKSTDIIDSPDYLDSNYARFLRKSGYCYSLAMPFGQNGRFHLAFYKNQEQGDFSEQELGQYRQIYSLLHHSYNVFEETGFRHKLYDLQRAMPSPIGSSEIILNESFAVLCYTEDAVQMLSGLFQTAGNESLEGSKLGFLELLFDRADETDAVRYVTHKAMSFSLTPFYWTDDLQFSRKYYRLNIAPTPAAPFSQAARAHALGVLTPKEKEVVSEMAKGLTYKEVAQQLFISSATVRNHMHNIYQKLELKNQKELMALYHNIQ